MEPSSGQISWAIEREGAYAGTIDLRAWTLEPGHSSGNIGFVTHPAARGRGVMSEAVALVVRHAFEELGWELVAWQANVGNVASYKAAWRCGFPVPVFVPALLHHKGRMLDGWITRCSSRTCAASPWRRGKRRMPCCRTTCARQAVPDEMPPRGPRRSLAG